MTESEWVKATDVTQMLAFLRTTGRLSERKGCLFACSCVRRVWNLLTDERSRRVVEVAERYADRRASVEELDKARQGAYEVVGHLQQPFDAFAELYRPLRAEMKRMLERGAGEEIERYYEEVVRPRLAERGFERGVPLARYRAATAAEGVTFVFDEEHPGWDADAVASVAGEARAAASEGQDPSTEPYSRAERDQCALIRDVFGDGFHPVTVDPAWLTWGNATAPRLAEAIYDERQLPSGHLGPAQLAILADALEDAGCSDADLLDHLRGPGPHVRGCQVVDALLGKE